MLKNLNKNLDLKISFKVLTSYFTSLFLFFMFFIVFLYFAKKSSQTLLPFYSFIHFLILSYLIHKDMKSLYENQHYMKDSPSKRAIRAFVTGLIGFIPYIFICIACFVLSIFLPDRSELLNIIYNATYGPIYFLVKLLGDGLLGFIAASLSVPLLCVAFSFLIERRAENIKSNNTNKQ